ncbi:ABC-type transport system, ATPase component, putative LPS export system [Nitrospira defluvii]|uniref:ABC-type transport system, ATPase component, putative LPS export system n=1 Tax=Nitrospira defluvii TaxID=330214 RepID=D8PAM4_9BACT|nr:ABC-type transport system, ATPase component, putative LPS export system [Nitrospira defluvii]
MSDIAIKADCLSKHYRLGAASRQHNTLRDHLMHRLRGLTRWGGGRQESNPSFWALKDISFEVKRGEVLGIVGHNGAGKSTLLKILSRITQPTTGTADIYGRVSSLLEVGTGFHSELSGRENIYLNAAMLDMRREEVRRKFDEIVAFSGVEAFIDTPVKRYSSGMYVRLAFAVAAHLEPEILIVDEVLAVGDASFQQKCLGKMEEVSRSGRTVLIVSHNMTVIEGLCERAILLEKGRVAKIGNTHEVVEGYADAIRGLAGTEIEARHDREGLGEILLTRIEVMDTQRHPVAAAITGRDVVIRMYYRCAAGKEFLNCRVSISVNGRKAQDLFVLSTDIVDPKPLTLRGEGYVDFIVPELPLTGGAYFFQSYIESNGHAQDWIKNVAPFSVLDADYYGTGKLCPPGWEANGVLVRYRWEAGETGSTAALPIRARAS